MSFDKVVIPSAINDAQTATSSCIEQKWKHVCAILKEPLKDSSLQKIRRKCDEAFITGAGYDTNGDIDRRSDDKSDYDEDDYDESDEGDDDEDDEDDDVDDENEIEKTEREAREEREYAEAAEAKRYMRAEGIIETNLGVACNCISSDAEILMEPFANSGEFNESKAQFFEELTNTYPKFIENLRNFARSIFLGRVEHFTSKDIFSENILCKMPGTLIWTKHNNLVEWLFGQLNSDIDARTAPIVTIGFGRRREASCNPLGRASDRKSITHEGATLSFEEMLCRRLPCTKILCINKESIPIIENAEEKKEQIHLNDDNILPINQEHIKNNKNIAGSLKKLFKKHNIDPTNATLFMCLQTTTSSHKACHLTWGDMTSCEGGLDMSDLLGQFKRIVYVIYDVNDS